MADVAAVRAASTDTSVDFEMRNPTHAVEMSRKSLVLFVFLPAMLGLFLIYFQMSRTAGSITPREAYALAARDSTIILLDVRTPAEFDGETGHVRGALLLPIEELEGRAGELDRVKDRLIIAYCRSGRRSRDAAALLGGRGFRVLNLEGGILAWNAEQLPVVREGHP
jgi:rhodanese-related sulfurtransferase